MTEMSLGTGSRPGRCLGAALAAALVAIAPPAVASDVAPLVLLKDGAPVGCGFLLPVEDRTLRLFLNARPGRIATVFDPAGTDAVLTVGPVSTDAFAPQPDGTRTALLEPGAGARLFQAFAVGGGTVRIGGRDLAVKGPLPQSARALFLNCSGDMTRQLR